MPIVQLKSGKQIEFENEPTQQDMQEAEDYYASQPTSQPQRKGFLKTLVEPLVKTGVQGYALGREVTDLGALGLAQLRGGAQGFETEMERQKARGKDVNVPLYGPVTPIGVSGETSAQSIIKGMGLGAETAPYLMGGGTVSAGKAVVQSVAQQGAKVALKKALPIVAKRAAIQMGLPSAIGAVGQGITEEKGFKQTAKEAAGAFGTSTILGIAGGMAKPLSAALSKAPRDIQTLANRIAQATTPEQEAKALGAIRSVNLKGATNARDVANRMESNSKSLVNAVDGILYNIGEGVGKINPLKVTEKGKHDFIQDALGGLEDLYSKIIEPDNLRKVNDLRIKYGTEGLSLKEMNELAKWYGAEIGEKAFDKAGNQIASTNAKAYENIRAGVKELARSYIPSKPLRSIVEKFDEMAGQQIFVKDQLNELAKKSQRVQNKLKETPLPEQLANKLGKTLNAFSGGFFKGLINGVTSATETGGRTLNAYELEKELPRYLKALEQLSSAKGENEIIAAAKNLISIAAKKAAIILPQNK